jgi:hypothetical protein
LWATAGFKKISDALLSDFRGTFKNFLFTNNLRGFASVLSKTHRLADTMHPQTKRNGHGTSVKSHGTLQQKQTDPHESKQNYSLEPGFVIFKEPRKRFRQPV